MKGFSAVSVRMMLAAIVIIGANCAVARADAVNAGGSTAGCFNCGSMGPFGSTSSLLGPPYQSSTFDVMTSFGNSPDSPNFTNRGAFQFQINNHATTPRPDSAPLMTGTRGAGIAPETVTFLLVGAGLIGVAVRLRRQKRAPGAH